MSSTSVILAFIAVAFCLSAVSAQTVSVSNCTLLDSSFLVNQTDLGTSCVGVLLPSNVFPVCTVNAVQVRLVVYSCLLSFTGPRGTTIRERNLIAQAGILLNNMEYLNLGSSTTSVALAAAIQANSEFSLFFNPQVQLQTTATTAFGSRVNTLATRGPTFTISSPSLTTTAPLNFDVTFVNYFNTLIRGPRSTSFEVAIGSGPGATEQVDTDTIVTIGNRVFNGVASALYSNYPSGVLLASQQSVGTNLVLRSTCCTPDVDLSA